MLRVIVVDDEAPARRYLLRLLKAHEDIEVVGEASSHAEATAIIATLEPDAVFMDIELGDGDGMELWADLTHRPFVIFVTAHADRAPRAFDVEALDYLLKPVGAPRMADAIHRLQRAFDARRDLERPNPPILEHGPPPGAPNTVAHSVVIRSQGMTKVIKTGTISAIVANGDYVELRMAEAKTELMYVTLTKLADQLPSPPFMRLSRSLLLNLDHVAKISATQALQAQAIFSTRATPVDLGRVAAIRLRKVFA
jgi:two-component system LytT family response regulator